jgi:selenium metabolism protein YedF
MQTLDCRQQQCPHPVVAARKALLAAPQAPLTVLVGDDIARQNIIRLGESFGCQLSAAPVEGGFALTLTPGAKPATAAATASVSGKTVLFLASDSMGSGSDELGQLLLKNYLFTLTELGQAPDAIFCVNAAVKLVVREAETREALEKLACMGTDIAACGLCLDFFHLKEQLAVGRVTNMLDIAENLQQAGKIIRL